MKHLVWILVLVTAALTQSCNSKNSTTATESTTAEAVAAPASNQTTNNTAVSAATEEEVKPTVSTTVTFVTENQTVKSGTSFCVDVKCKQFSDVLSMQYSTNWDVKVLTLEKLQQFTLKDLTANNFGTHGISKGFLTTSWYDQALKGNQHPDGTSLYQMCFKAIGAAGTSSPLEINGKPVIKEITNTKGDVLGLSHQASTITIE